MQQRASAHFTGTQANKLTQSSLHSATNENHINRENQPSRISQKEKNILLERFSIVDSVERRRNTVGTRERQLVIFYFVSRDLFLQLIVQLCSHHSSHSVREQSRGSRSQSSDFGNKIIFRLWKYVGNLNTEFMWSWWPKPFGIVKE